jgi:hypothetical protein
MSAKTDFKKALQALTTTVVDAEAARTSKPAAFEALRSASVAHRQVLREKHAALVAELGATASGADLPYATWFAQTLARAEALFGPDTSRPLS